MDNLSTQISNIVDLLELNQILSTEDLYNIAKQRGLNYKFMETKRMFSLWIHQNVNFKYFKKVYGANCHVSYKRIR